MTEINISKNTKQSTIVPLIIYCINSQTDSYEDFEK